MKQWALIDPQNNVQSMSNCPDALHDIIDTMPDAGEGWAVVSCDPRFWSEHPELTEADRCG